MPRIIPIRDLKDTAKISEICHASSEPVYVTKNGYGDMVFMSMEAYEAMEARQRLYQDLELSERQIAEGRTKEAHAVLAEIRSKYGI